MFYEKYLKYKQKYFNLKKNFINQIGGEHILLFIFNNNYRTIYQYLHDHADADADTLNVFKNHLLNDPQNCLIFYKFGRLNNSKEFNELQPFTILNICTNNENIKQIVESMKYNVVELDMSGEATPMHRTISSGNEDAVILYTNKKSLELFLYDVIFSRIDFYIRTTETDYQKIYSNYYTQQVTSDPKIKVTFDSGNSAKTTISRDLANKLGCRIDETVPKPEFGNFCFNIYAYLYAFDNNTDGLFTNITRSGNTSKYIYDQSIHFLNHLKIRNIQLYNQFIENLNLYQVGGVNSSAVSGFAKTTFYFIINGTEANFLNRKGKVIPLLVEAEVDDNPTNSILINANTIKTLEHYKLFLSVSDNHKEYRELEDKNNFDESIIDGFKRNFLVDNTFGLLEERLKTDKLRKEQIEVEKSPVEKMKCETHFYKFDINSTKIELQESTGNYIEPQNGYNILFDTGNAAVTLINPRFITANPNIAFNEQNVKPHEAFYVFLGKLIETTYGHQLRNILKRWLDRTFDSKQIYAEFIGNTSAEFQHDYKNYFINYLNLLAIEDANHFVTVKGGTTCTFNLKLGNPGIITRITGIKDEIIIPIKLPHYGDPVRIQGLQSDASKHMNGRNGFIKIYNPANQRWEVQFDDNSVGNFKTQNLQVLLPINIGSHVILSGLQRQEMNGRTGICENYNDQKGRFEIRLNDGTIAHIRPDNLILIPTVPVPAVPVPAGPSTGTDILISVDNVQKLNKQLYFIGNLQETYATKQAIEELVIQIRQLNPHNHDEADEILQLIGLIRIHKNYKFDPVLVPCINDAFIPKKFYEDIIKIAFFKLNEILFDFKKDFIGSENQELKIKIKELDRFTSQIGEINIHDIERFNLEALQQITADLNTHFKTTFIKLLQEAVAIANKSKEKSTPEYKINDICPY
jgi:hypothetical protein